MAREDLHFRLRLPEGLHDRIRVAAALNRRSITAEVVARLENTFSKEPLPGDPIMGAEMMAAVRMAMAETLDNLRADPDFLAKLFPKPGQGGA